MSISRSLGQLMAVCLLALLTLTGARAEGSGAEALLPQLADAPNQDKAAIIGDIAASGDTRARRWLEAFANGKLARMKDSGDFVIVLDNKGRNWTLADALSGETIGQVSRRELSTLRVNNALRAELEGILSVIDLTLEDVDRRLAAARELRGHVDATTFERISQLMAAEENEKVKAALTEALAIYRVEEQGDLAAVALLSGSLNPQARAALTGRRQQ